MPLGNGKEVAMARDVPVSSQVFLNSVRGEKNGSGEAGRRVYHAPGDSAVSSPAERWFAGIKGPAASAG